MSLVERVMNLLMEAQAQATASERQAQVLERDLQTAKKEMEAARAEVSACQQAVADARRHRESLQHDQAEQLAALRQACERLGIRGPDAP